MLSQGCKVIGFDSFNDYYPTLLKEARSTILKRESGFSEIRGNLADRKCIEGVFSRYSIEYICNLAAQAGVRYSLTNPYAYEESNLSGFLNVLEAARHSKVRRLVYASSSSVYGGNTNLPFSEKDRVDTPISLYAATKKANELMAHCYSHLYGIQTVGLRFFTVYGPWGRPDMAMWLFADAMQHGEEINVFNYGKIKRDFTFVEDIVNGIVSSLFTELPEKYSVFNLGNHISENLMDVIAIIEKELGIKAKMKMLPIQPGDIVESFADIDRAREKLGFEPKTPIEKGIPQFIKWFKEHPEITDAVRKHCK